MRGATHTMMNADPFTLIVFLVAMTLLPYIAMITTSYLKIVVVMSLIRNALGIQSIPPNMVINAMAMIISLYIMAPTVDKSWEIMKTSMDKNTPQAIYNTELILKATEPYKDFLSKHTADRHRAFFVRSAEHLWSKDGEPVEVDENSFYILIPSFTITELTKAFQIGFLVYLPFIAIDIIVSNILLAMGMMMVSPVTISLPFKLLLFVLVDGWTRLIQGLVLSYAP